MKKQFRLMALASVTMLFAACSQENLLSPQEQLAQNPENNAIQFGTYMGKAVATRAETPLNYEKGPIANTAVAADGIKSLAQARFGVFAYLTTADYNPATPTSQRPDFMYNQELKYDDVLLSWIYTPVKYWPNGIDAGNTPTGNPSNTAVQKTIQKLSFFAYAPYKAPSFFDASYAEATDGDLPSGLADATTKKSSTATKGITAMTTNNFNGNVWVKYALPTATEQEAVDLLWGLNGTTTYNEADNSDPSVGTIGGAYNINLTKQAVESTNTQKVQFLFKHALAKIQGSSVTTSKNLNEASSKCGFSVKLDVDGNNGDNQTTFFGTGNGFNKAKTLVTIKSVKIQDGTTASNDGTNGLSSATSDIYNSGWFNIETGNWNMAGAATGATININVQNNTASDDAATNVYTLNPKIRENSVKNTTGVDWNPSANSSTDGYTGGAEGVEVTAKPLFANEYVPGLMFIPGQDQTIYVTVDYIVRTADANLSTGYSEVEQVITNKVTLPAASLVSNKIFKIIMHLGLTSVKFEAKVADWQTNASGSYDNNGQYTSGGAANEQSIWLPSNVVE